MLSSDTQLVITAVFFLITNYFVSCGLIYGWAGLQRQLRAEGQFSGNCDSSASHPDCVLQDSQLNTIAQVAFNMANVATVVHGFGIDRYGPRGNAIVGGMTFSIGMILLAVSDSSSLNIFIPAYTMIGWGGIAVFLASFQFANLFSKPNLWRSILNALFTAAGLIFTIIYWMYRQTNIIYAA